MRLGDLDALKEDLKQYFSDGTLDSVSAKLAFNMILRKIDNAPTVEPFEPDYVGAERVKARQRGYEEGYHYGMKIGKTLNPKIKQGKWIERTERITLDTYYECSNCKEPWTTIEGTPWQNMMNFCPKCGAKMRGGAEE